MSEISLPRVAYILALLGGIIMLLLGILSFLGISLGLPTVLNWGWGYTTFAYSGIVTLICGIIAIVGAKNATAISWAIILIIAGIIGGGLGGLLVVLGGIIGLIIHVAKA